ncbi:hypothetical protein QZH41_004326 [Actinostola sp. cb2023]|nr:hypothetical protein QZH41_004326 [Actinostola sp. cb2023]
MLRYYNLEEEVTLQCDVSKSGLGAALLQNGQPVAYASRALTSAETRYAQFEKELLAIVFACEKFESYIYGRDLVTVETDHKPLESIILKPLHAAPQRLQRMLLRLQKYRLRLRYTKGKEMFLADTLSRAFLPSNDTSKFVHGLETVDHTELYYLSATQDGSRSSMRQQTTASYNSYEKPFTLGGQRNDLDDDDQVEGKFRNIEDLLVRMAKMGKKTYMNNIPYETPKLIKPTPSQPRSTVKCRKRITFSEASIENKENTDNSLSVQEYTAKITREDPADTITRLENELHKLRLNNQVEIDRLKEEVGRIKFSIERFRHLDTVFQFYTGFPNYAKFKAFYNYLSPSCTMLRYFGSINGELTEGQQKRGRKRSMSPEQELFMVLARLRCNLLEQDLAIRRVNPTKGFTSRLELSRIDSLREP